MRYSVYDYTRRAYDYYDAAGPKGTHAGSPPQQRPLGGAGVDPDRASWRLPPGATKVGSGAVPVGRIASMGAVPDLPGPALIAVAIGVGYLAWSMMR